MGLLSKAQGVLGLVRNKSATALGGMLGKSPLARRVIGSAAFKGASKIALGGARFAGKALFGTKIRAGLTIATLGLTALKKLKGRSAQQQVAAQTGQAASNGRGLLSKIGGVGKFVVGAAGVGGAAFLAEQLAEKAGVRGGAGFFGRRKRKSKKHGKTRRARGRGRRRRRGRRIIRGRGIGRGEIRHSGKRTRTKLVSFTTKKGQRVRFRVRR